MPVCDSLAVSFVPLHSIDPGDPAKLSSECFRPCLVERRCLDSVANSLINIGVMNYMQFMRFPIH